MEIDHSTGETVQSSARSPRFTLWVAFCVFSVVTMGASVEVKNDNPDNAKAKYAAACSILTVILTGGVSVGHLFPVTSMFIVGTLLEGALSLSLAALWAACVAIVTKTDNGFATSGGENGDATTVKNQVTNGNLYYFSWAAFVTSIILLTNYIRSVYGVDVVGEVRNRGARISMWAALIAVSLILAGSSSRAMEGDVCDQDGFEKYCKRARYGIAVGSIGVILSVVVVLLKTFLGTGPFVVEMGISMLLAVLNAFGVAYITSNQGPGAPIGNLYYSSWGAFVLSGLLAAEVLGEYRGLTQQQQTGATDGGAATSNGDSNKVDHHNGEFPVETLNDV